MERQINIYTRATALSNACGRVDYISNPERQEHLDAVHDTGGKEYWKALTNHCRNAAAEAGHKKTCEAREFMVSLDNSLYSLEPQFLAERISALVKEKTGTENVVALHWNKKANNFHAHIITSENKEVNEVTYGAVLTRDTYFDANGKRSTKSKCVAPQTKELLPGCEMIPKGGRKETFHRFGSKSEYIGSKMFLHNLKEDLANLQNELLQEEKFKVFRHDGLHIPQQHIGKGLPKDIEDAIKAKNDLVREYNFTVNKILETVEKNEPGAKETALNSLKKNRDMMKQFGGTDKWIYALQVCLEQAQKLLNGIKMFLERQKEKEMVPPIRRTSSIRERLESAKQIQEQRKPPSRIHRTNRDEYER